MSFELEHPPSPLVLDGAHIPLNSSIHRFNNGRASYVANSVKQALLLPQDMAELRNLKKHEMFLFLKRDLALVRFPSSLISLFTSTMFNF